MKRITLFILSAAFALAQVPLPIKVNPTTGVIVDPVAASLFKSGNDIQPLSTNLTAWAGIPPSDKLNTADAFTQTAADALYQQLDSDLTSIAALSTTIFGRSLLTQADASALRTTAGLVIGTNVQAWSANLDIWSGKTPYAGTVVVTTSKTVTISNTLTITAIDGVTLNIGGGGTLGTAAYTAASAYDAAGSASTAQAYAVQRANHTGTQAAGTITGLAASATTDTTNAANITSGSLATPRIPTRAIVATSPFDAAPVATRFEGPGCGDIQRSNGTTELSETVRSLHLITSDCTDVRVLYTNYFHDNTTQIHTITVTAGWDDGTNVKRIFFGGRTSVVIEPGGYVWSDPIPGLKRKGAHFNLRSCVTVASGDKWPKCGVVAAGAGEQIVANSDVTLQAVAGFGTSYGAYSFWPTSVTGTLVDQSTPSIGIVGDSHQVGGATWGKGYGTIALGSNYGQNFNHIIASNGGLTYATMFNSVQTQMLTHGCSDIMALLGANDFNGGSPVLATVQANAIALWKLFSDRKQRVWTQTVIPNTTSTDGWTTLGNQTLNSGNTARIAYNNWLRGGAPMSAGVAVAVGTVGALVAGQSGHPLSGYFETADAVESSRDSGKWAVASVLTGDGIHPNGNGVNLLAAAINTAVFTTL